jgi:hypothetical protein
LIQMVGQAESNPGHYSCWAPSRSAINGTSTFLSSQG